MVLPSLGSPLVYVTLAAIAALEILGARASQNRDTYQRLGRFLMMGARMLSVIFFTGAAMAQVSGGQNLWLLAIPIILSEALISHNTRRVIVLGTTAVAVTVVTALVTRQGLASVVLPSAGLISSCMLALVLRFYHVREEVLHQRNSRLETVLESASTLATSNDLRSMMLITLRLAVQELDAYCGYVMLVDEEDENTLLSEIAYSVDGEFQFPERIAVGQGMTGYAVKMGQPIAIHNDDEQFEVEGLAVGVKSAVSVPLVARSYVSPGKAATDQVFGALTLLSRSDRGFSDMEDLQLLRSLASLMAVGVSNARMEQRQRTTFLKTLESLAKSLEARDTYTRGHSQRVCEVSIMIGEHLGLGPEAIEELRVGTILHDIGKIGVPDTVLNKPGRLTDEEFRIMKTHPVIGYEICKPLMLSEGVLMIIRNHHEKLDGSGYPDGLKGGELPLSLRIVCVADAFDAMSSKRPYRNVMDMRYVMAELSKGAGVQFDPIVVESLKELLSTPRMQECYRNQWGGSEDEEAA